MTLLRRFDPPAMMTDLDHVPNGRRQWDEFMDLVFNRAIEAQKAKLPDVDGKPGTVQFFNPRSYDPDATLIEQAIVWNAFPKTLAMRFGRERAMVEADTLWPLAPFSGWPFYDPTVPGPAEQAANTFAWTRPLDEYCEWRVERNAADQIVRVTFTSEPPEYWTALFGGEIGIDDDTSYTFEGDPAYATELYRQLTGQPVQTDDLRVKKAFAGLKVGQYNPYNKWNTTHGIVHLNCPPNSIGAEVQLGADATVLYGHGPKGDGAPVTYPDELICCAAYGGVNRNSDPTIGASVNALARLGAMVTLVNPIGLYMDDIDLSGWWLPDGIAPKDCVRIVRGRPGQIERLVVEVPADTGRTLSDLLIGGVPLRYGGQIAELITVKLVGGASNLGAVVNGAATCVRKGYLPRGDAYYLRNIGVDLLAPLGWQPAFRASDVAPTAAPTAPATPAALSRARRAPIGHPEIL